jgi:hypothetical protein
MKRGSKPKNGSPQCDFMKAILPDCKSRANKFLHDTRTNEYVARCNRHARKICINFNSIEYESDKELIKDVTKEVYLTSQVMES